MPGELWSERRAVVGLNFLNGEGEVLSVFPQEVDGHLGVVVIVDAQNTESGRFVNGCKLIKAPTRSSHTRNKLHIESDRAARHLERRIGRFSAGTIILQ
jgi:hypothetical protein